MKQTLGEILRQLREKEGLTQQELANLVLTSPQSISRWEKDEREPSFDMLKDLLFHLGNPPLIIENRTIEIGGIQMETLREKGRERLRYLSQVIDQHDDNEHHYSKLVDSKFVVDLSNEIVETEMCNEEIPKEIDADIYIELPYILNCEIEEAKTKKELENTVHRIDVLIDFWERIIVFENQRIEEKKKALNN